MGCTVAVGRFSAAEMVEVIPLASPAPIKVPVAALRKSRRENSVDDMFMMIQSLLIVDPGWIESSGMVAAK